MSFNYTREAAAFEQACDRNAVLLDERLDTTFFPVDQSYDTDDLVLRITQPIAGKAGRVAGRDYVIHFAMKPVPAFFILDPPDQFVTRLENDNGMGDDGEQ